MKTAIHPDDPRLTAYALGELDKRERAEIKAQLAADAELRKEVDAVRDVALWIKKSFRTQPTARLDSTRRTALLARVDAMRRPARLRFLLKAAVWLVVLGAVATGVMVQRLGPFRARMAANEPTAIDDAHTSTSDLAALSGQSDAPGGTAGRDNILIVDADVPRAIVHGNVSSLGSAPFLGSRSAMHGVYDLGDSANGPVDMAAIEKALRLRRGRVSLNGSSDIGELSRSAEDTLNEIYGSSSWVVRRVTRRLHPGGRRRRNVRTHLG